jgi:hypothetical protein
MSDSYIKSYLTCQRAYNGFTPDSTCIDYAAQQAQNKYEDYLKGLLDKGDSGDYQALLSSINSGEQINNNVKFYRYDDDTGRNVYWTGQCNFYDNNSQLELPPVTGDTAPGGPYDADSDPNTWSHTANAFTRNFDSACINGVFTNILEHLKANMSDEDYHFTLGNLSSPEDQEKLCALKQKMQPLVTFFTALNKVAQAYARNPSGSASLTLDLPGQSISITSTGFASMLQNYLNQLGNLGS